MANRTFQNVCKSCSKDQTIVLQGKDDVTKRKMFSEIRYFLLENSFPKIDQSPFDSIDFVITLLTMSMIPPLGQSIEATLLYNFSFGTINHNLVDMSVTIKNFDLVRIKNLIPQKGNSNFII